MAITDKGNFYGWGNTSISQLATKTIGNCLLKPTLLKLPNNEIPETLSLNSDYSIVISKNGNIYVCGSNTSGQLGLGTTFIISYF